MTCPGKPTLLRRGLTLLVIIAALIQLHVRNPAIANAQSSASRQTSGSDGLSLSLAIDMALRGNPMVRAAKSGRELADAQLSVARSSRFPLLQIGETFTESNNPVFVFGSLLEQGRFGQQNFDPSFLNNPNSTGNFRTTLTFRLPIFDQKQSGVRINQARIGQQQADWQQDAIQQQIRFEVLRAYYGVLVAQARKQVAEEAVKAADADVKRIGDLVDTGMVVLSDRLSAEVQFADFRQQQIQAEGDLAAAQAALNTVMGIAVDMPQKVAGQLAEKVFNTGTQTELIRVALERRPDLARAGLAVKSSKEGTRGARAEYLPRLDVFGIAGVSGKNVATGSSDYAVGASVTFNLFDAGRGARFKQARAAEDIAAAEAENLANQIRLEVVRAYQQYVSARERVAVTARAVDQALESLRIVQDRYREGLTTITELLRAETAYVRARMNLLAARYEHYVGYASVLLVTGRLLAVDEFVS